MKPRYVRIYIAMILTIVGLFMVAAYLSPPTNDITGAAVQYNTRGGVTTLCKDVYYDTPLRKDVVQVFYGSQYPDQCYDDKEVSEEPTNNGRYLRDYYCNGNDVDYRVFDCGTSKCQYGACVNNNFKFLG